MEMTFMGFFYKKCSWEKAQLPISSVTNLSGRGYTAQGLPVWA